MTANIEDLYCFNYTASNEHFDKEDGWNRYTFESEFERMGCPNQYWVQTTINNNYEICDTYPRNLYVPSTASKQIIIGSANFRSKGRLPALTYLHKNNVNIDFNQGCARSATSGGYRGGVLAKIFQKSEEIFQIQRGGWVKWPPDAKNMPFCPPFPVFSHV